MKPQANKEAVLAQAWAKAETFLLDIGLGLDGDGNPDERELEERRAELEKRLGRVWDECVKKQAACEGHPAGKYDQMGNAVYCDGSCRR